MQNDVNISFYDVGRHAAAAAAAFEKIGDVLEPYLTHELTYQSSEQN